MALPADGPTIVLGGTHIQNHGRIEYRITNYGPRSNAWFMAQDHVAAGAMHDSEAVMSEDLCLPGTRILVLDLVNEHVASKGSDTPPLLWLNGPAGAGKSAIMRTVSQSCSADGVAVASFFFSRGNASRSSATGFVITLAHQLSQRYPQTRPSMEAAFEADSTILSKPMRTQAELLLIRPWLEFAGSSSPSVHPSGTPTRPFVLMIDGLDECYPPSKQLEVIDTLVYLIGELRRDSRTRIQVVLASRPEVQLAEHLARLEADGTATTIILDQSYDPDSDIQLYYNTHFDIIRRTHRLAKTLGLDVSWPSLAQIRQLVELSSGQFAFAQTAKVFTGDPNGDPRKRLEMVLGAIPSGPLEPFEKLDHLYATVFAQLDPSDLPNALAIVGLVLDRKLDLDTHPTILELALQLDSGTVHRIMYQLASLFSIKEGDRGFILPYHATLGDFVFNEERSRAHGLFIDRTELRLRAAKALQYACTQSRPTTRRIFIAIDQVSTNTLCPRLPSISGWRPWAVLLLSSSRDRSCFNPPSCDQYTSQTLGFLGTRKALGAYKRSVRGKLCLSLAPLAAQQDYIPGSRQFFRALIKYTIMSDPDLSKSDQGAWKMSTCDPERFAEASITFLSEGGSKNRAMEKEVLVHILQKEWHISTLPMLSYWHTNRHDRNVDPWVDIMENRLSEPIEGHLLCRNCSRVLHNFRVSIFERLLWNHDYDPSFISSVYHFIRTNDDLWSDGPFLWQIVSMKHRGSGESWSKVLRRFSSSGREKEQILLERQQELTDLYIQRTETLSRQMPGWTRETTAHFLEVPYSLHCLPLEPNSVHFEKWYADNAAST